MGNAIHLCAAAMVLVLPSLALPAHEVQDYSRRVWLTRDGLPEETIQAIVQTPDGYLWIGTTGGLVRFDGAQFTVFDHNNTPALLADSIFCLTVSTDGSLWIGTEGGFLARYKDGAFRSYSADAGLSDSFVRVVHEDRNRVIRVGTDHGLFQLQGERISPVKDAGIAVHAIAEDRAGRLWVGGAGLLVLERRRVKTQPVVESVKSILETRDGTIWIGTINGLRQAVSRGNTFTFPFIAGIRKTVRVLREDREETLWIGMIGGGLMRYRAGKFNSLTAPRILPSNTVLAFCEDRERSLWVGTQTGMVRLTRPLVHTVPLSNIEDADFGTISEDRDGVMWFAGPNLYRVADSKAGVYRFAAIPGNFLVRNVFRSRDGALWLGTEGGGAFRLAAGSKKEAGLAGEYIRAFAEGKDGTIWIGTDGGLGRWRRDDGFAIFGTGPEVLCYSSVRALLVDRAGALWIGTDRGVSRLLDGKLTEHPVVDSLKSDKIWAIFEDSEEGLWFGTRGNGLFRWKQGTLTNYTTAQGLADNSIYHILEDARGYLWMSGPTGIARMRRSDLENANKPGAMRPPVTLYGLADGLETTQMCGGVQPAGWLTARGEVWFPTVKGPVWVDVNQAGTANTPRAVVDRIAADGQTGPLSKRVVLAPGRGRLEIHYSAVQLRSQERVRFRYKLEGLDEDWTETLGRRVAYYTNVPPGQYRFRVIAFDMSAPERPSEASVQIVWRPYFYRSTWFFVMCVAVFAASLWCIHALRMRHAHARFAAVLGERTRLAREMHDTLLQGCAGVSSLLEASSALAGAAPEVNCELMDRARVQVRETIEEARRAIWDLRAGSVSGRLSEQLFAIAHRAGRDSGTPITCEFTGSEWVLNASDADNILKIANEAILNAIRHGHPDSVRVHLSFESHHLRLRVQDDGCGVQVLDNAEGANGHYGLVGMRERTSRMGGSFQVTSRPGQGTCVDVSIPLRRCVPEVAPSRT